MEQPRLWRTLRVVRKAAPVPLAAHIPIPKKINGPQRHLRRNAFDRSPSELS
jgi:hypothetical protein